MTSLSFVVSTVLAQAVSVPGSVGQAASTSAVDAPAEAAPSSSQATNGETKERESPGPAALIGAITFDVVLTEAMGALVAWGATHDGVAGMIGAPTMFFSVFQNGPAASDAQVVTTMGFGLSLGAFLLWIERHNEEHAPIWTATRVMVAWNGLLAAAVSVRMMLGDELWKPKDTKKQASSVALLPAVWPLRASSGDTRLAWGLSARF